MSTFGRGRSSLSINPQACARDTAGGFTDRGLARCAICGHECAHHGPYRPRLIRQGRSRGRTSDLGKSSVHLKIDADWSRRTLSLGEADRE
jgi:hypothetical protein